MLKFKHKKHLHKIQQSNLKFVIYYSLSDILLGLILIMLTVFFASYYITQNQAW